MVGAVEEKGGVIMETAETVETVEPMEILALVTKMVAPLELYCLVPDSSALNFIPVKTYQVLPSRTW